MFTVIMLRIIMGVSTEEGETALMESSGIKMSRMRTDSDRKVNTIDETV